ncbi:MAG: ornithine--oxo-acid transaminase [Parcubacteria group bacterium]|nr:ornithine--oxo-acid transaminase [Parcubacteria group bacterium]
MAKRGISALSTQEFINKEKEFCAPNYHPLDDLVVSNAEGVWMYDVTGKKYLDMMSAYSAVSFGHCNRRISRALMKQASELCITSRAFYSDKLGSFAEKLCRMSGMDMTLPMNTGAEAVETAIKGARRWGYQVKKITENRAEIIVAEKNFHGRTTTIIGFSSEEAYQRDFGPFTPGFKKIPFGNVRALERAITPNTCAFLVEPIQGEAGIIVPPRGWLKEVASICKERGILLILDEIQTGLGRTGKLFAFQHELDTPPDGLILGKALGGGVMPVSAFLGKKEIMSLFTPGSHGSTFGGNPLACALGLEVLAMLEEEDFVERSRNLGFYLFEELKEIESSLITDIRGKGLFVGIEIDKERATAREVCERLKDKGVLSKETHETVVRFAPPLVITEREIEFAVEKLAQVLDEIEMEELSLSS